MKIVFSRKGFDSSSGGAASPIIANRPRSIPIPAENRSETTYGDLGLGDLVNRATKGKLDALSLCHNDPMFEGNRCAFGQAGAAQGHLANNRVGIGDIFLFFGLFAKEDGTDRHHRIFGYLMVEQVSNIGSNPRRQNQPRGFSRRHPHVLGEWNSNNTIYTGSARTAMSDAPGLRLTQPNGPLTLWTVPSWLAQTGLSYHRNSERWRPDGTLQSVARGQEFVTDIAGNKEAGIWLQNILDLISQTSPGSCKDEIRSAKHHQVSKNLKRMQTKYEPIG